jgi:gas vesicle protein
LNQGSDTGRIEQELDYTRSRLDATIGALQEKLAPGEMVEQAIAYFREGGGVEFRRNLGHTVRENPIPVALIGVGLGWLMLSNARQGGNGGDRTWTRGGTRFGRGSEYDVYGRGGSAARGFGHDTATSRHQPMPYEAAAQDDLATKAHEAGIRVQREPNDTDETFQDRVHEARGAVLGLTRKAGEAAASFRDRVEEALSAAANRVRDLASDAGDAASGLVGRGQSAASGIYDYGRSAGAGLMDQGSRTVDYVQEQPLLLGALGIAVGAAVGLLIPPSRYERELAGSVRRNVGEAARDAVHEAGRRASRVADSVLDTAQEATRREGFATGDAKGLASAAREQVADAASRARHVVEETAAAGREALQRELSGTGKDEQQHRSGATGAGGDNERRNPSAARDLGSSPVTRDVGSSSANRDLGSSPDKPRTHVEPIGSV